MKVKSSNLKSGIYYTFFGTCHSVVGIFINILILYWLLPKEIGLWNAISVISLYTPIVHLGIQSALNLDLPILLGKNDTEMAMKYVSTAKYFAYFSSLLVLVVSLTVFIFIYDRIDEQTRYGLLAEFGIIVCSLHKIHLIATFRASKYFNKLSIMYGIQTALDIAMVYLIYRYHYYGLLFYNFLNEFFQAFFMHIYAPYRRVKPDFFKAIFFALFKRGVLQLGMLQLKFCLHSAPRLIILNLSSVTVLGLFAPALSVQSIFNIIPQHIGSYVLPQIGYKYGQNGSRKEVWNYTKKIFIFFPLLSLPVTLVLCFSLPYIIDTFFPKYHDSVTAMIITLFAFIFASSTFVINILVLLKEYKNTYIYYILALIYMLVSMAILTFINPNTVLTNMAYSILIQECLSYITGIIITKKSILR